LEIIIGLINFGVTIWAFILWFQELNLALFEESYYSLFILFLIFYVFYYFYYLII